VPDSQSDFVSLAQASHPFPPTRVTWEPKPSSSRLTGSGNYDRETELLATTGDALRVWEVSEEGDEGNDSDEEEFRLNAGQRGYVGVDEGDANGRKVKLRERSKLTNVSPPRHQVFLN
jgi:hypothetical protein